MRFAVHDFSKKKTPFGLLSKGCDHLTRFHLFFYLWDSNPGLNAAHTSAVFRSASQPSTVLPTEPKKRSSSHIRPGLSTLIPLCRTSYVTTFFLTGFLLNFLSAHNYSANLCFVNADLPATPESAAITNLSVRHF